MLEFYREKVFTYHNGVYIGGELGGLYLEDKKPQDRTIKLTWDNLLENFAKDGAWYRFGWYKRKKGLGIEFYSEDVNIIEYIKDKNKRGVTQWKNPGLNITIEYKYEKVNRSISEVLDYPDNEKAIRYLVERGLTVIQKYDTIEKR